MSGLLPPAPASHSHSRSRSISRMPSPGGRAQTQRQRDAQAAKEVSDSTPASASTSIPAPATAPATAPADEIYDAILREHFPAYHAYLRESGQDDNALPRYQSRTHAPPLAGQTTGPRLNDADACHDYVRDLWAFKRLPGGTSVVPFGIRIAKVRAEVSQKDFTCSHAANKVCKWKCRARAVTGAGQRRFWQLTCTEAQHSAHCDSERRYKPRRNSDDDVVNDGRSSSGSSSNQQHVTRERASQTHEGEDEDTDDRGSDDENQQTLDHEEEEQRQDEAHVQIHSAARREGLRQLAEEEDGDENSGDIEDEGSIDYDSPVLPHRNRGGSHGNPRIVQPSQSSTTMPSEPSGTAQSRSKRTAPANGSHEDPSASRSAQRTRLADVDSSARPARADTVRHQDGLCAPSWRRVTLVDFRPIWVAVHAPARLARVRPPASFLSQWVWSRIQPWQEALARAGVPTLRHSDAGPMEDAPCACAELAQQLLWPMTPADLQMCVEHLVSSTGGSSGDAAQPELWLAIHLSARFDGRGGSGAGVRDLSLDLHLDTDTDLPEQPSGSGAGGDTRREMEAAPNLFVRPHPPANSHSSQTTDMVVPGGRIPVVVPARIMSGSLDGEDLPLPDIVDLAGVYIGNVMIQMDASAGGDAAAGAAGEEERQSETAPGSTGQHPPRTAMIEMVTLRALPEAQGHRMRLGKVIRWSFC